MFVTAIEVQGLRDLPRFVASDLGPVVTLAGPTPRTTALGDALELFFGALQPSALQRLLRRLGALGPDEQAEILGAPLPEQATWTDTLAGRWLPDEGRAVTVTLELALDPVQLAALRGQAVREPRLASALSREPLARVTVGGLMATSFDAIAVAVQGVVIGGEPFPYAPGQRAPWMTALLSGLAGRFARHTHDDPAGAAATVLDAATSWDRFGAYERWRAALSPTVPHPRAARGPGGRPLLLSEDLPLRRQGPAAMRQAALAADVYLSGADLLWVETDDPWVDSAIEGDGSALEQVWRVCKDGAIQVHPGNQRLDEVAAPPLSLSLRLSSPGHDEP